MLRRVLSAITLLAAASCGHSTLSPGPSTAAPAFQFSFPPIDMSEGAYLLQRGYSASINSTLRFQAAGTISPLVNEVYAPADGQVTTVTADRIEFAGAGGFTFYLTGVVPSVTAGQRVMARERVGSIRIEMRQGFSSIGLGLLGSTPRPGFLRPERLSHDAAYGLSPLDYFPSDMRAALSSRLHYQGNPELGADVAGTLQGLWFLEGSAVPNSDLATRIFERLWFVPTLQTPGAMSVHFNQFAPGITLNESSVIPASDPAPRSVTPASGVVFFHVLTFFPIPEGVPRLLMVQMLDADHVRAEAFAQGTSPTAFTSNARTFVR